MCSDLTTSARIRDAAIRCVSEGGVAATTVRKVAAAADVSPGLVIHHFGSMEGLLTACDAHVAGAIRTVKHDAMASGPGLDLGALLRASGIGHAAGYVARRLVEDSPEVDRLVDDLVADAVEYFEAGVASGLLRPTEAPRSRVALLAVWSLGALALHRHLERLLGVDLTDPDVGADPAIANYLRPAYEILGVGLFTPEAAERLGAGVATLDAEGAP